jgi:hypothetical protein
LIDNHLSLLEVDDVKKTLAGLKSYYKSRKQWDSGAPYSSYQANNNHGKPDA